ncbi:MAG: Fur family transcriptional regulator, partial [Verrucomicrobiia bacterium]
GPRQLILDVLRREEHPLTTRQIHEQLDCDLATVYRSLRLLEEMAMVKRFDFGDGTARFELLGQNDDGHHHHLVCRECSTVVEIGECFSGNLESRIARQHGFASVSHRLEFFGLCPECQAA